MKATSGIQSFFRKQSAPVTMGLICGIVAVSVLVFLAHGLEDWLILTPNWLHTPWALLTYPFVNPLYTIFPVVCLLFTIFWLYWIGGTIEGEIGSLRLGILWLVATLLGGAAIIAAGALLHVEAGAESALLPVSFLTVVWGFRHPTQSVLMMGFFPLSGFWIAWLDIAIVLVIYGQGYLPIGIAACLPYPLAWAYATDRLPIKYGKPASVYKPSKAQIEKENLFRDEVKKRKQEREERERLRKLFEGSLDDKG